MDQVRYELRSQGDHTVIQFDDEQKARQWASDQFVLHGDKQPVLQLVKLTIHEEVIDRV